MIVSYDKNEMKITNALWFYYFSKAIEFLDTIFMVVRKRFTQITFLHVFHHFTMLIIWWIVMTWIPVRYRYFLLFLDKKFFSEWSNLVWSIFKFNSTCFYVFILWFISYSIITG